MRAKTNATFKPHQDIKFILHNISITAQYDIVRTIAFGQFIQSWEWYEMGQSAKSYKVNEIYNLFKVNKDIFNCKYNKYLFLKLWLF